MLRLLASVLVAVTLARPLHPMTPGQVGPPSASTAHAIVVEVRDPTTGLPCPRRPVGVVGTSVLESTDDNGIAVLEFQAQPGGVATVFTQTSAFAPAYADVQLDAVVEHQRLWSAPRRRFETPRIDPFSGDSFVLEGPVSPYLANTPTMRVEIDVPPFALTEPGLISISPLPAFAATASNGVDPFGLGAPHALNLAEFEISLVRPDGTIVEDPSFAHPITLSLRPWAFAPLGDWNEAHPSMLQVRRLESPWMQLLTVGGVTEVDPLEESVTITLDSFGRYAITVMQDSAMPPAFVQKIGAWVYGWFCTGWPDPQTQINPCTCDLCSHTPSPTGLVTVTPIHTCTAVSNATVECGELIQAIEASCASAASVTVSAEAMQTLSAELGVETGALSAAIAQVSASIGHSASVGVGGALTVSTTLEGSSSMAAGSSVSNKRGGRCMSGVAYAFGRTTSYRVEFAGLSLDVPGVSVCSGVGFVYDLAVDLDCSIASSPPKDCAQEDAVPVRNTISCAIPD